MQAFAYAKFAVSLLAFAAYLLFALRLNEKLKPHITGVERAVLLSLSLAGAAFVISKANACISERYFRD
jgi:hypothetical protein